MCNGKIGCLMCVYPCTSMNMYACIHVHQWTCVHVTSNWVEKILLIDSTLKFIVGVCLGWEGSMEEVYDNLIHHFYSRVYEKKAVIYHCTKFMNSGTYERNIRLIYSCMYLSLSLVCDYCVVYIVLKGWSAILPPLVFAHYDIAWFHSVSIGLGTLASFFLVISQPSCGTSSSCNFLFILFFIYFFIFY